MRTKKARLAALLTAGAMTLSVSAPALAQNQANQVAQINTGNLISALNNVNAEINNLQALNDLTVNDVRVVNVEDALNNNNVQALNNALNRNQVDIDALQDFLNQSLNNNVQVIVQALNDFNAANNNNVDLDDVVAVDVLSNGDVVVYAQQ